MATTQTEEVAASRRATIMQELDPLRITDIAQIMNAYNANIRHFLTLCSQVNVNRNRERLRRPRDIFSINYEFHPDITSLGLGTWRTAAAAAATTTTPLTLQEIMGGTRVYSYVANEDTEVCPITHNEFQENDLVCQVRGCLHVFKYDAIMQWFTTNTTCPVCRYSLREGAHTRESSLQQQEQEPARGSSSLQRDVSSGDAATAVGGTTGADNNEALLQLIRAFFPSVGGNNNNESMSDFDISFSTFFFPNASSSSNRRSM